MAIPSGEGKNRVATATDIPKPVVRKHFPGVRILSENQREKTGFFV